MKRLSRCCCCCNVRDGSITVGVLGILLSIATIIFIWLAPSHLVSFKSYFFEEQDKQYSISKIIMTISLCFTILICSALIIAIKKRRSWLMLPFVVLGLVLAIGLLISILHTSIVLYTDDKEDYTILATCILVGGLIYLILYLYLWVVVFSHYLDTRDEEERGRYSKSPYRR
ncbi:uncharacterized protein LOC134667320 [Cydia fagiglandana]|uniref:uncharacterized protein LOC134650686 n=1 Tax=Cydia amplana TaxID=1869771 RepID=UPI002143D2D5